VDFINHATSELRVWEIEPVGQDAIKLGAEILGPYKIARSQVASLVKQAHALMRSSALAAIDRSLLSAARSSTLGKSDNPFKNLRETELARGSGTRVVPGLLTADGRLLIAGAKGAQSGIAVFVVDGGIASYQYWAGDIDKSAFNEKIEDAAIKSAGVGGAVAVAVLLGSGPGAILAIGIGSYIIADFGVQQWRENTRVRLLNLQDLEDIGVGVNPDIPLNVEHWDKRQLEGQRPPESFDASTR
jgi:hypothetical protein